MESSTVWPRKIAVAAGGSHPPTPLSLVQRLACYPQFEHREGGWRWQVYRQKKRGGWKRPAVSNEDRVWSEELGCWLRVVEVNGEPLLRLGAGEDGEELFLTKEEEDAQRLEVER